KEWTAKYFFTEVGTKATCLICKESVTVFKEYNLSWHFSTKHANYASNMSREEWANRASKLAASLQAQQDVFFHPSTIQGASTKASYLPAYKIAKQSKPLSEGELLKERMIETVDILCPESKNKFEKISLSRWVEVGSR
ncbi:GT2D2 protein, partial [Atractosteus spatula]|nr:GT2D2 protein [Atractosteus spatula]